LSNPESHFEDLRSHIRLQSHRLLTSARTPKPKPLLVSFAHHNHVTTSAIRVQWKAKLPQHSLWQSIHYLKTNFYVRPNQTYQCFAWKWGRIISPPNPVNKQTSNKHCCTVPRNVLWQDQK